MAATSHFFAGPFSGIIATKKITENVDRRLLFETSKLDPFDPGGSGAGPGERCLNGHCLLGLAVCRPHHPSVALDSLGVDPEVATALRGRRGTAAALGLAWATLLLWIVLGPYRMGQTWTWWAILCSVAIFAAGGALRFPSLGTSQGVSTGLFLLAIVVVGLLLDVRRVIPGSESAE